MTSEPDELFSSLMSYEPVAADSLPAVQATEGLDEDFDEARKNLQEVIAITQTALEDAAQLAKQMAAPRGYDSLAKLITAAVQTNKALLEIHKNRLEGKTGGTVETPVLQNVTNNNLFLTTSEMLERIKEAKAQLGHS